MGSHSVDVTTADFQRVVIVGSRERPVLVDFWAEWCGPCRVLKPILEKLADEYGGRFLLAKVDSDHEQALAGRYRVRGIPSVKAFLGGEVVDEFTGAQPESNVRRFIERLLPSPAEPLRKDAAAARAFGDLEAALAALDKAAAADPNSEDVVLDRAEVLLDLDRPADARAALGLLPPTVRDDARRHALAARIDLAESAARGGDAAELERRIAADGNDLDARLALGGQLVASGRHEEGLEQFLEIVRRDRSFGDEAGRKAMLKVFAMLGSESELVSRYRRMLASALH